MAEQDIVGWLGTSLVVQWLGLHAPNAGRGPGLTAPTPSQAARSHILQLRVGMLQANTPPATTKTQHSQIKK